MSLLSEQVNTQTDINENIPNAIQDKYSTSDYLGNSVKNYSMVGALYQEAQAPSFDTDLEFKPEIVRKRIEKDYPNMPNDYKEQLIYHSVNEDAYKYYLDRAKESLDIEAELDRKGLVGEAYRFAGSMADVIPMIGTAKAGTKALQISSKYMFGAKARNPLLIAPTRERDIVSGVLAGFGFSALQDEYGNRDIGAVEYGLTMGFSGALSGLLHSNSTNKVLSELQNNRILGLDKEVLDKANKAVTEQEQKDIIKEAVGKKILTFNQSDNALTSAKDWLKQVQKEREDGFISEGTFDRLRTDMNYLTASSPIPEMRVFNKFAFIDDTLQSVKGTDKSSVFEQMALHQNEADGYMNLKMGEITRDLAKDFGGAKINFLDSKSTDAVSQVAGYIAVHRDIGALTEKEIEHNAKELLANWGTPKDKIDSYYSRILGATKDIANESYDRNVRFENKHFDSVEKRDSYFPNKYSFNGLDDLKKQGIDEETISNFFFASLYSGIKKQKIERIGAVDVKTKKKYSHKDVTAYMKANEEKIKKASKKIQKFVQEEHLQHGGVRSNSELFKKALNESGFNRKETDELFNTLQVDSKMGNDVTRIPLDRTYKYPVSKNGKKIYITLADFLEKDYISVQTHYNRKMAGQTAGQKFKFFPIKANNIAVGKRAKLNEEIFNNATKKEKLSIISQIADFKLKNKKATPEEINKKTEQIKSKVLGKKGWKPEDNLMTVKDLGSQEGREAFELELRLSAENLGLSQKELQAELARFNHLANILHGKATAINPSSNSHKAVQIAKNLNVFRLLGSTVVAMTAELHNVIAYTGFRNAISSLKNFSDTIRFLRSGKINNPLYREMISDIGIGSEFIQGAKSGMYDVDYSPLSFGLGKTNPNMWDRAVAQTEKMAEFTMMIGGMKPATYLLQTAVYTGVIKSIMKFGKKATTAGDRQLLKESGLSDDMINSIQSQIDKYATKDKNGNYKSLGVNKWDTDTSIMFKTAQQRLINSIIQRPSVSGSLGVVSGEHVIASTVFGKLFMELKQYMYESYVKQLGKIVKGDGAYHKLLAVSQAVFLSAVYMGEQLAYHGDNNSELQEALTPENIFVKGVLNRSTSTGSLMYASNIASNLAFGSSPFGHSRGGQNATSFLGNLTSVSLANDTLGVVPAITSDIFNGEFDKSGKALSKAIPNFWFLKLAKERLNDDK